MPNSDLWVFSLRLDPMDGKNCVVIWPPSSGSAYDNYNGLYSVAFIAFRMLTIC